MHNPQIIPPLKRPAFTLIELLVVVAIIALMVSILLPTIQKARDQARVVLCASNQRQIVAASLAYAADSQGAMPYRGGNETYTGNHYPHEMVVDVGAASPKSYDLNKILFSPYMNIQIKKDSSGKSYRVDDQVLFCAGRLMDVRHPGIATPFDYRYLYITYQYYVMPRIGQATLWLYEVDGVDYQPYLTRITTAASGRWPMWGCMTLSSDPAGSRWLGHDAPETNTAPSGMNGSFYDGSVAWTTLADCQPYYQYTAAGQQWYWPKPNR